MTKKELEDALAKTENNLIKSIEFNQELRQTISDQQLEIVELKMDLQDWFDELEECKEPGDLGNFALNLRKYLINKLSIKHRYKHEKTK